MSSSRDADLIASRLCECCRHFRDTEGEKLAALRTGVDEHEDCMRCVACGEWCEDCNEIALLHDSGLCEDCCHHAGCTCGDEDPDEDPYDDDGEGVEP